MVCIELPWRAFGQVSFLESDRLLRVDSLVFYLIGFFAVLVR